MFYDIEDPREFLRDVKSNLHPDGLLVFEQSYMPLMFKRLAYDTVCHQHLSYYSLRQFQYMFRDVGFKIVDVSFNDCNGGSFVVTAAHEESLFWKENEKKVLMAVRILLDSAEQIEIFNKTAIYLYLRDLTGLNTKPVVNTLTKLRNRYRTFKTKWQTSQTYR